MNMNWILECFPEYQILIEYDNIDDKKNKQEVHGLKEQKNVRCMFCKKPFPKWKKKDVAHAISECVGNKALINFCECYDCNHLNDGFRLSIPRQNYDSHLVYASLLKMAYTILPQSEIKYYQKELCKLYLALSLKPFCDDDGNEIVPGLSETDRQEYLKCLPNFGMEMCLSSTSIPNGVNVCLLKRSGEIALEPKLLFAIQMKWHTIVIPVLSDNYKSGEKVNIKIRCNENVSVRKIDFTEVENDFVCDMICKPIEIPDELFPELEENLRNSGLLKNR